MPWVRNALNDLGLYTGWSSQPDFTVGSFYGICTYLTTSGANCNFAVVIAVVAVIVGVGTIPICTTGDGQSPGIGCATCWAE